MPLTKRLRSLAEKKSNGPKTRPLDDFIIVNIPKKGKGVLAKKYIPKGDTVLEYCGVIRTDEPHQSEDDTYIFECVFKGKQYWLDATHDDGSLGRLINDDRKPNLKPKMVPICGEPHIFFYAIRDIHPREELLYCYGNGPYPWRNTTNVKDSPNDLVSSIQKDSIPVTETDNTANTEDTAISLVTQEEDENRVLKTSDEQIINMYPSNHQEQSKIIHPNTTNVKDSPNDLVSSIQKDSVPVTETDNTANTEDTAISLVTQEEDENRVLKTSDEQIINMYPSNHQEQITTHNPEFKLPDGEDVRAPISGDNNHDRTLNLPRNAVASICDEFTPISRACFFVLSGFRITEEIQKKFRRVAIASGFRKCRYLDSFSSSVTHVLMKEDPCDRTAKYLQGIAKGCWILSPSWITDSVKHRCIQPEEGYEINGDNVTCCMNGPRRARLSSHGILHKKKIYVELAELDTVTVLDIPALVMSASGILSSVKDCDLILFTKEKANLTADDTELLKEYGRRYDKDVVTVEWLLDSLCVWTLQNTDRYTVTSWNNSSDEGSSSPSLQDCESADPLYEPSDTDTDEEVIDNSAGSDDSSEIPILDPKALNQTEENIQKDGVTVKLFSQNENGKKIWDKKHYCLYCNKPFAKLPRHLETQHKDEIDVIKLRSLDRRSKEQKSARATLIDKLRKAGNYNHNIEVLKSGQGEVVPKKSLSKSRSSDDYLPCRHCLGFYLKHDLYRHVSKCTFREEKLVKGTRHQSNSAFLLPSTASEKAGSDFQKDVVADMSVDNISLCARNDELIILFGEKLYKKHKALPHMHQYIRTKMRELSRFLLKAREEDEDIVTLSDCIQANKFETCVKAVRSLCGVKCGTKADIPSLALKIGFSLSKCANIRLSKALVEGDSKVQDNVERFQRLYSMDWNTEVSSTALKSLETKKWNKPSLLPLTNDVVKFQKYLDQQIDANIKLLESKDAQGWRPLCEAILVSIILFNRRRSGEVERLSLDVFSLKSKTDLMPDVKETLNNLEKHLVENLSRVETRGKRGRKVPILFPKKTEEALDLLIQYRSAAGIEKGNPYVFANNALGYVRGADCMRSTASEAKLENPENMRSTNLRKHVATLSQVVNLRDNELDILAQFLGHDVKVHRNFYRLPEDTIQIAKVGKLLMAANKGTLGKFSGKSLDDISIDQEVSDESESEDETTQSTEVRDQDDANQDNEKAGERNSRKSLHSTEATCMTQKSGSKRTVKRIPWTEEERSAVKSEMEHFLRIRKTPGKLDCDNCLRKYQCLSRRNWKDIKNFVYNCIQSLKKCH